MNGATEATLQDLLAVAQAMNANIVGLNRLMSGRGSGGGTAGSAGGSGPVGAAAGMASSALSSLGVVGKVVGGAFSLLGTIVGKTITGLTATAGNLFEFAKAAAMGTAKLSDFYNAFRDLPFFIGNLFSLAADIVRYQEGLLDFYRKMSSAGATFGGSLSEMRRMAAQGFMSMEEFTKVIRANSEVFATLGGNVDAGARKFIETQSKLLGPGSKYSQQLLGLGYTTEQISDMLTNVYNSQATLNRTEIQNANKVAAAVAESARELDLFSRATGKQREELEKQQKKLSLDTAFKTFTAGITDPKQRAAMENAINKTISMAGEDAGDLLKQMFMTGGDIAIPLTEGSKQFMVAMGDQAEPMLRALYNTALNPTMDGAQRLQAQMGVFYDMAGTYKNNILDPLGRQGAFLQLMNNRTVGQLSLQALLQRRENLTREQFIAQAAQAQTAQNQASMGTAGSLAQAQVNIKNFGAAIMDLVYELVGPIASQLLRFGQFITAKLFPVFQDIVAWFRKTVDDLMAGFKEGGFRGLFDAAINRITKLWDNFQPVWIQTIKPALESMWNKVADLMTPYLTKAMNFVLDAVNEWVYTNTKGIMGEDPRKRRLQRNVEDTESAANTLFADIRRLRELRDSGQRIDEAKLAELEAKGREAVDLKVMAANLLARYNAGDKNVDVPAPPRRHSGTLGMTGSWWEKENKVVEVQAGETVATQAQIAQIVDAASQNGMAEAVSSLNSSIRTLISVSQKIAENTAANVAATKRLDGNVFTMV